MDTNTKICKNCEQSKPLGQFYKSKGYKDGYTTKCKQCNSLYYEQKYQDKKNGRFQPKQINVNCSIIDNYFKICSICNEKQELNNFHKKTQNKSGGGYANECKSCTKIFRSKPRYEKKELRLLIRLKNGKKHPEIKPKARKR